MQVLQITVWNCDKGNFHISSKLHWLAAIWYLILDETESSSPSARFKENFPSLQSVFEAVEKKNSLEFAQFPTVTGFKPKTKHSDCCSLETHWKRQKTNAKKRKKQIRRAEYPPELLTDTDECFVHCCLLNIVPDQCNQEQSPHYNEQVAHWRQISEAVRYFCGTVR